MARKKASSPGKTDTTGDQTQATGRLALAEIRPDPGQPRRLLPGDLLVAVTSGRLSPEAALEEWLERAELEPGLGRPAAELKRLAETIARHGLINPITIRPPRPDEIVPPGVNYLVLTGERRYWAHVYLASRGRMIQEGETATDPTQIKAILAPAGVSIRAHQLIENLLREDINAVERARGMWALRYELSGVNYSSPPAGDEEEPPAGLVPWSRVEETLGISKRYRIFVTGVLNLSEAAQAIVERYNLAEMTIRPIVQKLKDRPELQLTALQQVAAWYAEAEAGEGTGRAIGASVQALVEELLAAEAAPARTRLTRAVSSAPAVRFRDKVRQTLDFLNRLRPTDRADLTAVLGRAEFADVMVDLRNLRQQIDELLDRAEATAPPSDQPEALDEAGNEAGDGED